MGKFLLSFLILSVGTVVQLSHTVIDRGLNNPRSGDVLILHSLNFSDTVSAGDMRLCDLSHSEVSGRFKIVLETAGHDSLSCISGRTRYLFFHRGDSLFSGGFENNLSDMVYDNAEVLLTLPADYGTKHAGNFVGHGRYTDRLWYKMAGRYITAADARGTLIMPEGDTIPEVVRLVTERHSEILYFPDSDKTGTTASDSLNLRARDCRWYARGYRYPLLITSDLFSADGSHISHAARYIPLSAFDYIDDPDNEEIRRQILNPGYGDLGRRDENIADGVPAIDYTLSQDKAAGTVTITYSVSCPMDLEFILTDIGGIVYRTELRHCDPGEFDTITFDYGSLPYSAAYGVNITGGQERYSEKFYR